MLFSAVRTVIIYIAALAATRLMGKREIGNLSPFDLVIAVMIAELGAMPLQDNALPLRNGLIPMAVLAILEIALALLAVKSVKVRRLLVGEPTIVIEDGRILDEKMRHLRYNINDLLTQLRDKNVFNVADVECALLEPSGKLSVLLKSQRRPVCPEDMGIQTQYEGPSFELICDGQIQYVNLKMIGLSVNQLMDMLKSMGISKVEDVFFASIDSKGGLYVSKNKEVSRTNSV